jgi:hypothetical protein
MTGTGSLTDMEYVVKTDAAGNKQWEKTFTLGDYALDDLSYVTEGPDNNLYATGFYPSSTGGVWMDVFFLKFKLNGDLITRRGIPPSSGYKPKLLVNVSWAGGNCIKANKNGDIMIAATIVDYGGSFNSPALLSLKPASNVNYYYPYYSQTLNSGYYLNNRPRKMPLVCADDGYYFAWNRDSVSPVGTKTCITLQKTDLDGKPMWSRSYCGLGNAMVYNLIQTPDGALYLVGGSSNGTLDNTFPEAFYAVKTMVLKTNANGDPLFVNYTAGDANASLFKGIQVINGDIVVAGHTSLNNTAYDKMFTLKLNATGGLLP